MHLAAIGLILGSGIAAEADAVAEVIAERPGHDGIEVDDGDPLARSIIQHHIVELGIVVRDAQRNLPRRQPVDKRSGKMAVRMHPVDLPLYPGRPCAHVPPDGTQKIFVAYPRVVKAGEKFIELRSIKPRQESGKIAERHGALVKITPGAHALVRRGALDEHIHPKIVFAVRKVVFSRSCGNDGQTFAHGIAPARQYAPAAECSHERNVVHELCDIGYKIYLIAYEIQNSKEVFGENPNTSLHLKYLIISQQL